MYLLDANVFIQAKNFYYSFDICPGFWDWMDEAAECSDVYSITKIRDELISGNDELANWAKQRKDDGRFLDISDKHTQNSFIAIVQSINNSPYKTPAKSSFLSGADPWLIAKATTTGATLVTHEKAEPAARKRVPIPNICEEFGVPYINTFELLTAKSACFKLDP